uniref:Uncharacterized protein n=1 Tax=Anguilla anguilla TaxID=7936 RepID=A0A0E9VFU1_ANGAN
MKQTGEVQKTYHSTPGDRLRHLKSMSDRPSFSFNIMAPEMVHCFI